VPFTATQIIRNAMLKLGYLESVEVPDAADVVDCFNAANAWIEKLAINRTLIFLSERVVHPLPSGAASVTIGPGGDISRARPIWIDQWSIVYDRAAANPIEQPMGRPLLIEDWQGVRLKSATSQWPYGLYYDNGFQTTAPIGVGTIFLYPVTNQSSSDLILYVPTPLAEFADLAATQYSFPQGYRRYIEHALAIEFAPILGAVVDAQLQANHDDAKLDVEAANFRPTELSIDPFLRIGTFRRYNIETG
jgi:hypothetical protein